ncbi:MAG: oligosaccharyl transferase, archaeosortase A system-associated [Methanoregulaceae archaeon]|nr:MAG: oligosaccharyl transferase, archaeosortase A system-associated [Methanoregulaceae archaeon]
MKSLDFKNRRFYLIIGLISLFSLFALWLRLLPMLTMGNTDVLMLVASDDPLYNLRQVEQILANFPDYGWFDAMTMYPHGTSIYWGPLFPTVIAVCCLLTGAVTRTEIISVGLLIPPLMAVATIAVMYFVGKTCGDWKTGILASGFTAIITGQFFYRSLYGYMDHHIAEVLFSTLFCLFYMYAILSEKGTNIDLKNPGSYKSLLLISGMAGIAYLLGLFTMPTMILFAMIAGIFTVIQFIIDVFRGRTSEYLLLINITIFVIAIIGLLVFGLKNPGIDLSTYSIGHIYAYLGMIFGTGILYLLQHYLKDKEKYYYPAALAGCGLAFAVFLYLVVPQLYTLLIYDLFSFFGQAPVTNTVQEARGWALDLAWLAFNYGLLLMTGGVLVMIYKNIHNEHPEQVFALIWSVVMFFSTWQHVRYEYYLAINIALLAAVCVTFLYSRGLPDIRRLLSGTSSQKEGGETKENLSGSGSQVKKQKKSQKKVSHHATVNYPLVGLLILVIGLSLLFVYTSVSYSYTNAMASPTRMNADWRESMDWMADNTPDTGVDYLTIYDQKSFQYPAGSYGVMSWWDYGHLITYIAKRIPNANPFQQGVAGPDGAAAYFMAGSEDKANAILDRLGTRYVVTDIEMDTGKFWAMSTWDNATLATDPYQITLLVQNQNNVDSYDAARMNKKEYYTTTISRLHNFDGSLGTPSVAYYVEYADSSVTNVAYPVVITAQKVNATDARIRADQYNLKALQGYHAEVLNPDSTSDIVHPVEVVPALQHYRLVHESPNNVFGTTSVVDVRYVKIFEYVKGAHIKGDGTIEVPVITNTGRSFVYRQASVNGEFVVPYSTTGNSYDVKTTGKYTISGTGKQYDVPESAVLQGTTIQ